MNGAAMECHQEQVLCTQHRDTSGLQSPGYHLQINQPCQQNSQQYSKAMNYQSDHFLVDPSSESLQYKDKYSFNSKHRPAGIEVRESRPQASRVRTREPIELPVPKFKIDENYVGELPTANDSSSLLQNSKELDLDTRINLLIKSKALAGMHPIFSELDQSEESSYDSDDSITNGPKLNHRLRKKHKASPPEKEILCHESFDDPEIPLSRPPSPYLSRATYLFWFNKAIELKKQAKAQEQALLEKATKKIIQDNAPEGKPNTIHSTSLRENPFLKSLINEISKELKEIVKQEFIKEVIENTAFHTLEDWWEKQRELEGDVTDKFGSLDGTTEIEHMELSVHHSMNNDYHGSTSPKMPFPWANVDLKQVTPDIVEIHSSSDAKDISINIQQPDDLEVSGKPLTKSEDFSLENNCDLVSPYLNEEKVVRCSSCRTDCQEPESARNSTVKGTKDQSLHVHVNLSEENVLIEHKHLAEKSINVSQISDSFNVPAERDGEMISSKVEEKADKCSTKRENSVVCSSDNIMSPETTEIQLRNQPPLLMADTSQYESEVAGQSEQDDCNNSVKTEVQQPNQPFVFTDNAFKFESEVLNKIPKKPETQLLLELSTLTADVSKFERELTSKSKHIDHSNPGKTEIELLNQLSTLTTDDSEFGTKVSSKCEQICCNNLNEIEIKLLNRPYTLTKFASECEVTCKNELIKHNSLQQTEIQLPYKASRPALSADNFEIVSEGRSKSQQDRIESSDLPVDSVSLPIKCAEALLEQESSASLVEETRLSSKEFYHGEKNIPVQLKEEIQEKCDSA